MTLIELSEYFDLNDNYLNVYQYGSRVYGTEENDSDWDFICIIKEKTNLLEDTDEYHFIYYTKEEFQILINTHEISALECLFLDYKFICKKLIDFEFILNLSFLRHSLSAKSSNSYVKCKKKLTVEKDYNLRIGQKSLFHAFRILYYGLQIAKHGKIVSYQNTAIHVIYERIIAMKTWPEMEQNLKEQYNKLASEFRILAPKA